MMMNDQQPVLIPPTISNFACIVSSEDSRLCEILTCIARQNALTNFCPTRAELASLIATPCDRDEFGYTFEKPRFSRAYLHAAHLISILNGDVIERGIANCLETHRALADPANFYSGFGFDQRIPAHRLSNMSVQTAKLLGLLPHAAHLEVSPKTLTWHTVPLSDVSRFEAGFKDQRIRALYKSDLHTIKRLTRGRR